MSPSQAIVVVDENVHHVGQRVAAALDVPARIVSVSPGEKSKSLAEAERLYGVLLEARADRATCVVAVGGGVIGDLAGYVAATYARGLPLLMVPTSLLAQLDSSVGGKVGVNFGGIKNIVGAFHQPVAVHVATDWLATLPAREVRCGLGEAVRCAFTLDAALFAWIEANARALVQLEPAAMRHLIHECCRRKAQVVQEDPLERSGRRMVLNAGHTVGHVLESSAGLGESLRHGEAVAIGLVAECRIAEALGWIDAAVTARLVAVLEALGMQHAVPRLDPEYVMHAMSRDKKAHHGKLRFALARGIGTADVTADVPLDLLMTTLQALAR
jgi:3-dehydroquinate synthase